MKTQELWQRRGTALGPAWSAYLWEIAVLVVAAEKFPRHMVMAVAAVYVLRALAPLVTASVSTAIDTWPIARVWRGLLIGLGIASVAVLLISGPVWWVAVAALEFGQALVNPINRKILYQSLEPDTRKRLIRWLGTAENIAMPLAYGLLLLVSPAVGLTVMAASYVGIALAIPRAARAITPGSTSQKPSWLSSWTTTRTDPVAWKLILTLLPVVAVLAPLNPLAALLVTHRFHATESWVGLLFAGLAVGTIGGYQWADRLPTRRALPIIAVGVIGLALSPALVLAATALAVIGVGFGAFMSHQRQATATQINDSIRGQVQLIRQAGIGMATITGTLAVLGLWAVSPDLAWVLVGIGGGVWAIKIQIGKRNKITPIYGG